MITTRAQSGLLSNQRSGGTGLGPNGTIAFSSQSAGRSATSVPCTPPCPCPCTCDSGFPPSIIAMVSSSRLAMRTYPPNGNAASTYSVSPWRRFQSAGPKPSEKRGAYTPVHLAARKWPSS